MYMRTNYREVVSLMDYTMTNSKAALELPPIELQRAIKMMPSQVSFVSANYLRAMLVCTCIVRLCSCVDACIIDTLFGFNEKSIDSKAFLLHCFCTVESIRKGHATRKSFVHTQGHATRKSFVHTQGTRVLKIPGPKQTTRPRTCERALVHKLLTPKWNRIPCCTKALKAD
jgi:hypothetical protein